MPAKILDCKICHGPLFRKCMCRTHFLEYCQSAWQRRPGVHHGQIGRPRPAEKVGVDGRELCDLTGCGKPRHKKSNLCHYHTRARNARKNGTTVEAIDARKAQREAGAPKAQKRTYPKGTIASVTFSENRIEIGPPTDPSRSQSRFNKTAETRPKDTPAKVEMTEEQRRAHQEREAARKAELLAKARADALERGELANNYIPPHLAAAFERRAQ